jgi:hypothetical protein
VNNFSNNLSDFGKKKLKNDYVNAIYCFTNYENAIQFLPLPKNFLNKSSPLFPLRKQWFLHFIIFPTSAQKQMYAVIKWQSKNCDEKELFSHLQLKRRTAKENLSENCIITAMYTQYCIIVIVIFKLRFH